MIQHGYGRVLSRPGLTGRDRERITVAALAATRWQRQLVSHLHGARRLGVKPAEIRHAFELGMAFGTPIAQRAAKAAWKEVFSEE